MTRHLLLSCFDSYLIGTLKALPGNAVNMKCGLVLYPDRISCFVIFIQL